MQDKERFDRTGMVSDEADREITGQGQEAPNTPETSRKESDDRKNEHRKKTRRKKKRRNPLALFLIILLCAAAIAGAAALIIRFTPTNRRMSWEEYFGSMDSSHAAIVLQDEILEQRALVSESGALYLPQSLVRDSLNERFFFDEEQSMILFTTATETFEIPIGSETYTRIEGALSDDPSSEESFDNIIAMRADSDALYLNLDFVAKYTNIAYTFEKDTQHVLIRNQWGSTLASTALKDAAVRYRGGIKSPILTDLHKGDEVYVIDQTENWLYVLTPDGFLGYVKSNRMSEPAEITVENEGFEPQEYPSLAQDEPVCLAWHMVSAQEANKALSDTLSSVHGLNVISPTWFALSDNSGNIESTASAAYVKEAHERGLSVWGLVNDFSSDMDTSAVLASTKARRNCIEQLIGYAQTLHMDGINIDFEYVDPDDAFTYTEFVRELSIACRRNSLVLSVDTYPPYEFNAYLNRPEIAEVVDYIINMGYDEHYVGSESTGSVASLGYEEGAINNLLAMGISPKKILSGVPFYTRIWYTSQGDDGTAYINSEELSMNAVTATLESWNLTPAWDPVTAQDYVSWYTDDGVLCEIWIENAKSLQRKLLLIPRYELGGTAIWAISHASDSVWDTVQDTLALSKSEADALAEKLYNEEDVPVLEAEAAKAAETEAENPGLVAQG